MEDDQNLLIKKSIASIEIPSNKVKVKVKIETLPPFPNLKIMPDIYEGIITINELIQKLQLISKLKLKQKEEIFVFLKDSFLVNPFEKLSDLANCFGSTENEETKEITLKIANKAFWG